jgi:hypothetical protein
MVLNCACCWLLWRNKESQEVTLTVAAPVPPQEALVRERRASHALLITPLLYRFLE